MTWGLLGPGKGIERVIDAMTSLHDIRCQPRYLVAGRTHPTVLAAEGEAYREARTAQVQRLGLTKSVEFDGMYRDPSSLSDLVRTAAVVVLPYDSADEVSSGVLVDAIANGRPVIATAFPHAVELLGSGAGIIVGHDDPDALVTALRRVLTEPRLSGDMAAEARRLAPTLAWPVVAESVSESGVRPDRRTMTAASAPKFDPSVANDRQAWHFRACESARPPGPSTATAPTIWRVCWSLRRASPNRSKK